MAYDPEHCLVVSVVPGKRTTKNVDKLVQDFKKRTGDRLVNLITSDEYRPYKRPMDRRLPQHRQANLAVLKLLNGLHQRD